MKLLFPCHPLKSRLPDPDYESEVSAARKAGFECEFYNVELLQNGDIAGACNVVSAAEIKGTRIVHRGWMMTDIHYSHLHEELRSRNYLPHTTLEQYAEAHYLPNWYPYIAGITPDSGWIVGNDLNAAWTLYQRFTDAPALVKDFVKSAKHRWNEACFIPAGTTRERFEEIIQAFLKIRGSEFNKGLVFRRYHELIVLKSESCGQPNHEEYRMFFWNGELLASTSWSVGMGPLTQIDKWTAVARRFQNRFIAMDVARQIDDSWIIIEVGDGGVSGLPDSIEPQSFYSELWRRSEYD